MQYFVLHGDVQNGPHELAEVRRLLREGHFAATDLCGREGWPEWRPMSSVVGLVPGAGQATATGGSTLDEEGWEGRPAWQSERSGKPVRQLVVLFVVVLFLAAGVAVLGVLLADARFKLDGVARAGEDRALLDRTILEAGRNLRGPRAPDEIAAWLTYEDSSTGRPMPVSRANVLLYAEERVRGALDDLAKRPPGAQADLIKALQDTLPSPLRETITDSDGLTVFSGIPAGKYVMVVFAKKAVDSGEENYLWLAECVRDEHPSGTVVFSEANAVKGSGLVFSR